MVGFLNLLEVSLIDDNHWMILKDLVYKSDLVSAVVVPRGFITDFASVPRVPIAYEAWGDRCHREAVVHDYLYCIDCPMNVSFDVANSVFLEAMKSRGVSWHIRYPMYWGVCIGGGSSYHKRKMGEMN